MGVELFRAGERTDRGAYMMKLMDVFHNFVRAPKNQPALTW